MNDGSIFGKRVIKMMGDSTVDALIRDVVDFLDWVESACENRRGKFCCESCTIKNIHAKTLMLLTKLRE